MNNSERMLPHIISSCPKISTRYYLPLRHDALAKYIVKAIIIKNHPNKRYRDLNDYDTACKVTLSGVFLVHIFPHSD